MPSDCLQTCTVASDTATVGLPCSNHAAKQHAAACTSSSLHQMLTHSDMADCAPPRQLDPLLDASTSPSILMVDDQGSSPTAPEPSHPSSKVLPAEAVTQDTPVNPLAIWLFLLRTLDVSCPWSLQQICSKRRVVGPLCVHVLTFVSRLLLLLLSFHAAHLPTQLCFVTPLSSPL